METTERSQADDPPPERTARASSTDFKALRVLHSKSLKEGRRRASRVLADAASCPCCRNLLVHIFDRVGSTLFFDDDPQVLADAFEPSERDGFASRVLAACIVLSGRPRIIPVLAV
jgi:hypothetical protein